MARRFRPEVVLCDIPGADGYAVARALRNEPELKDTSLIAVSGYGQEADQRRALEAGFDMHMIKPINLDEVEDSKVLLTRRFRNTYGQARLALKTGVEELIQSPEDSTASRLYFKAFA